MLDNSLLLNATFENQLCSSNTELSSIKTTRTNRLQLSVNCLNIYFVDSNIAYPVFFPIHPRLTAEHLNQHLRNAFCYSTDSLYPRSSILCIKNVIFMTAQQDYQLIHF